MSEVFWNIVCLYTSASCAAIGTDDFNIPSANASANIVEAPNPLACIVDFAASAAPLANAGNGVPCDKDVWISWDIFSILLGVEIKQGLSKQNLEVSGLDYLHY